MDDYFAGTSLVIEPFLEEDKEDDSPLCPVFAAGGTRKMRRTLKTKLSSKKFRNWRGKAEMIPSQWYQIM